MPAMAAAAPPPNWDISGNWLLDFAGGTGNRKFVDLVQDAEGNVTGQFWWLSGTTWLYGGTLDGHVSGDALYLFYDRRPTYVYTGEFSGAITQFGMSGSFTDSHGGTYDWSTSGSPRFLYEAMWQPPITNDAFELKDGTTLPIKFKLYDSGNVFTDLQNVYLVVKGPDVSEIVVARWNLGDAVNPLKFDPLTYCYQGNFQTKNYSLTSGATYRAIVYSSTNWSLGEITFTVNTVAGTSRGNK